MGKSSDPADRLARASRRRPTGCDLAKPWPSGASNCHSAAARDLAIAWCANPSDRVATARCSSRYLASTRVPVPSDCDPTD